MPTQTSDKESEVREFLRADVLAAWFGNDAAKRKRIHDDMPDLPTTAGGLPRAMVLLTGESDEGEGAGAVQFGARFVYEIVGQFPNPEDMTRHKAKMLHKDALLALLTNGPYYHNYNRRYLGTSFGDLQAEAVQDYFSLTVMFQVDVNVEGR